MNPKIKLILAFAPFLYTVYYATQKYAALVNYSAALGSPAFVYDGMPYYWPWKYFVWWSKYYSHTPKAFNATMYWPVLGLILIGLIGYLTRPKAQLTTHGTARWALFNDLKQMDLISSAGVVVGLYDSPFKKTITQFLRDFEVMKKEKEAFSEMDFDKKIESRVEKIRLKANRLENEIEDLRADLSKKELAKMEKELKAYRDFLENPPRYDAKKLNPFTVYPYVWAYKKLFKFYTYLEHFYLRDNSNKHMAVVAPTRSGKGVGLIIPTLLGSWKESTIVNDIKSENWGVTAGWRKKMGQKVIKFEPTATDGSSARWNPLEEIPIGTNMEVSYAQNLAAIIADYEGKGKPDHWIANATNVIATVILFLKYAHAGHPEDYPEPNLGSVAAFLKSNITTVYDKDGKPVMEPSIIDGEVERNPDGSVRMIEKIEVTGFIKTLDLLRTFEYVPYKGINIKRWNKDKGDYEEILFTPADLKALYPNAANAIECFPTVHPMIAQSFTEITEKAEQELGSIISTANTALKEYLDPVLIENTAVSDFCIDDVMNYKKPVSLYLVTPPSDLLRLSPVFRLFFEMMIKHHARSIGKYVGGQAKTTYKHKCLFLMDEFSSLGNLQNFAASLSYIAGYGMKVFLICQGIPQIQAIYGKDNQILMNCHLQIFYAPNDNDTSKYVEGQLGNQTIEVTNQSENTRPLQILNFQKSYSHNNQARALMTADEIKRLGDREIISASGFPPVLTDKVKYYENQYFTKKLCDAPIVSDIIREDKYGNPLNPNPRRMQLLKANGKEIKKEESFDYKFARNGKIAINAAAAEKEEFNFEFNERSLRYR